MDERFMKARALSHTARRTQWRALGSDPNIMGIAFGQRITQGQATNVPALVVYVAKKLPLQFVPQSVLIPRRVYVGGDYLEVDVVETGPFYIHSFTARERPAPSGISIGHVNITAGTLGCLVNDNTDQTLCILSNNHVMADGNQANIGDAIVQPGPFDGGAAPADTIATLKRFVMLNAAGNTVDGAIAEVGDKADVIDQMKDNLMPVPRPGHPAVGLLFAGSCNRTIMNPIDDVLNQLNIQLLAGAGSTIGADIGMNVEKVGRTTEYTTSTITEIDVTVTVGGYPFGSATFDRQIATAWMSDGGDSGSVVCQGGDGGNEDHCGGCASSTTAASILATDLSVDVAIEKEFREKYLSQTRIGRYAIDLYFRNENRIVERAHSAKISDSDQAFARYLYGKYIGEVRMALLQPGRSDIRVTGEHLREAREAVGRGIQYMTKEEAAAAEQLFDLARKAEGMTVSEVLGLLNDESLFEQVLKITSTVSTLEQVDLRQPDNKK
jgi:hypothetical protein